MEILIFYLLATFFLLFIYSIIISLFGYLIITIYNRDYLCKKLTLKRLLKTFAIGLSFHLIYGMIIISLRILNFFTIYLPFIICDIGFIVYIYYKKSKSIRMYFRMLKKKNFILFFKENISLILIFFIVFFLLYTIQMYFINQVLPYPGNDPYYWFNNIWFVHKYGFMDYDVIQSYPPGFVIFSSSIISFIDDYTFFYYFLKYLPIFFSVINLLVLYVISKDLFKKKINIYFTLVMYLGFTFIFTRNNKALPSLLATTLGFLFLLFLGKGSSKDMNLKISSMKTFMMSNIKNKKVILKGLLFTGISLAHPLYGLLYMIFYFFYEFFLFLKSTKTDSISKLLLIRNFFISQFLIFLIFVVMLSPYAIGTSINRGANVIESYLFYFSDPNKTQSLFNNMASLGELFRDLGIGILFKSFYYYLNQFFLNLFIGTHFYSFYKETIQVGIILVMIGLFLNYKKYHYINEKQNVLINFFKFIFILVFLLLTFSQILILFACYPIYCNFLWWFYDLYRLRLFELFSGYWAILFVLTFDYIIIMIKEKYLRAKKNRIPTKKFIRYSKISLITVITFTSGFFYITNFGKIEFGINFNKDQLDSILFIGNYFDENPLEDKKRILLENLDSNAIYGLIVDKNLEKKNYNKSDNRQK